MSIIILIFYGALIWAGGGFALWSSTTHGAYSTIKEDRLSIPQLIVLRLVSGPILWVYSIWQLLGLFGRRKS